MKRERALKIVLIFGSTVLLRCRLSACADGEARPCSGDDDESLRDTRRLLAARFSQPPQRIAALIAFAAWSSSAHTTVMGFQAFLSFIARRELLGVATFVVIGVALIALAPAKPMRQATERVSAPA